MHMDQTTTKTAGPKKLQPKFTTATKQVAGKSKKKLATCVKIAAAKTNPDLVIPTQRPTYLTEHIFDLLDRLPIQASLERTRRPFTCKSSLPTGAHRPRAVLKTVILIVVKYGSTHTASTLWISLS